MASDGTLVSNDIALGMVKALVVKTGRLQAGKSLKNMTYTRAFTDFANTLASLAPRAYRTFQKNFGGPHFRSLQYVIAHAFSNDELNFTQNHASESPSLPTGLLSPQCIILQVHDTEVEI